MNTSRRLPLLLAAALLGGCATLDESECAQGDWYGIGRSDGSAGYSPGRLADHRKACAKYGITPDPQDYDAGFAQGLAAFCVPARGFELGRRNGAYHGLCPAEAEADFLLAMELGGDVWMVEQELERIEDRIDELRDEIKDKNTSDDAREALERRLRHAKDERDRREDERDRLLRRARDRGYGNIW